MQWWLPHFAMLLGEMLRVKTGVSDRKHLPLQETLNSIQVSHEMNSNWRWSKAHDELQ
jgi:hypothetical protein